MVSLLVNKLYFVKFSSSTPPSQNVFLPSYILYMYIVYIRHLCTINIIYTHNTYKYIYIYALASCLQASTHTLQLGLARVLQPSTQVRGPRSIKAHAKSTTIAAPSPRYCRCGAIIIRRHTPSRKTFRYEFKP